jgi:hypothetical protein
VSGALYDSESLQMEVLGLSPGLCLHLSGIDTDGAIVQHL